MDFGIQRDKRRAFCWRIPCCYSPRSVHRNVCVVNSRSAPQKKKSLVFTPSHSLSDISSTPQRRMSKISHHHDHYRSPSSKRNSLSHFLFNLFVILFVIHSHHHLHHWVESASSPIRTTTSTTSFIQNGTTLVPKQTLTHTRTTTSSYVPVYIMMPLNTVNNDGSLNNPSQIRANLQKVKSVGTDGIMIDVWWGICEQNAPQSYNFTAYQQLFTMCQQIGLKVEPVMSFHQCGTNIGDAAYIPLPKWVLQVGQFNPDIFYTDQNGHRDREYLSLGVDHVAVFPTSVPGKNRTAVDIYSDFMTAFRNTFSSFIQSGVIDVIEIGLGPAGEMRYPSYQLQNNLWSFPGIGAFQWYVDLFHMRIF